MLPPSPTTSSATLLLLLLPLVPPTTAQQISPLTPEVHPRLVTHRCTLTSGCTPTTNLLVADSLAHPILSTTSPSTSCLLPTTGGLNTTLCPDPATCSTSCAISGIDYTSLGVLATSSALTLRQYLFNGTGYKAVSPRLYLLAEGGEEYESLKLLGQELSFDVDVSQLACGMNGALYLSEMDMSGGRGELNPAGAKYGTGYCDAQCFTTQAFINGVANLNSSGACCNEMDIWEGNSRATVFTPHTCSGVGSFLCTGEECIRTEKGSGVCDKSGCGINPYGLGNRRFYGLGGEGVDSGRRFTVVTQFLKDGDGGELSEIRRLYVQDGRVIEMPKETTKERSEGFEGAVTEEYCQAKNSSDFLRLGGMNGMGESLRRGMVLIFSIWNSEGDFMSWLDGEDNGPCNATEGDPANILRNMPDVSVTFSNIRWGDIGSTFNPSGQMVESKTLSAESGGRSMFGTVTGVALGIALLAGGLLS